MKPGGARTRRDSLGKTQKSAYVRSAKPTARRRRAATFVRTEDVSGGAAKAMKGTLNADAFTGRLTEKGTHKEHRLRVTGAPKGVVPTVPDPPTVAPPPAPTRVRRDIIGTARAQAPRAVARQQDVQRARPVLGAARLAPQRDADPDPPSSSDDSVDEGFTDADGRIALSQGDEVFLDVDAEFESGTEGDDDRIDDEQSDE